MRAAALVLAAFTIGCGAKNVRLDDPKTWRDRKDVWIHIAPLKELDEACAKGTMAPSVSQAAARRSGNPVSLPQTFGMFDVLVPVELVSPPKDEQPPDKDERPVMPYSCVDREFFRHGHEHARHKRTVLKLNKSRGETARFLSVEGFKIEAISGGTSPRPFSEKILTIPTDVKDEHVTGPVARAFPWFQFWRTRYKVSFSIRGHKVDPDVDCKP